MVSKSFLKGKKVEFILFVLLIFDFLFIKYNIYHRDRSASVVPFLNVIKLTFGLAAFSFALFFLLIKFKKFRRSLFVIPLIFLVLSFYYNCRLARYNHYNNQYLKVFFEYFHIKTCDDFTKRFDNDIKNSKVVYFTSEYVENDESKKDIVGGFQLRKMYVFENDERDTNCYNKLVEQYFKSNYNYDVTEVK